MLARFRNTILITTSIVVMSSAAAWGVSIKLATLAPPGSSWMKVFQKMSQELQVESGGEIKLRFYPGGIQGDEKDVVRKMQIGQVHAGAMTAVGLSVIQKEALIFQLPLLFESYEELDYVRGKLRARMNEAFERNGYVLLGWGDVGHFYIFSKTPIQDKKSLQKSKIWSWVDDPIAMALFKEAGITPVQLSVPEVLPSLQTGVVNAVPSSPLVCIALQWFSKVKYMTDLPLLIGVGATVITKKQFDKLDSKAQALLREVAEKYHQDLTLQIRTDNAKSIETLKENGMQMVPVTKEAKQEWEEIAIEVRRKLIGKLYPQELLDEVTRLIQEYRAGKIK